MMCEIEITLDQDGELQFLVFDGMTLLASFPTEDEALCLCRQLDEEDDGTSEETRGEPCPLPRPTVARDPHGARHAGIRGMAKARD